MKSKFNLTVLVTSIFVIFYLPQSLIWAELQMNENNQPSQISQPSQKDPVQATLKAIEMAKKAVEAVEEAAKAVAQASEAIEQAKMNKTMKPEDMAFQEENLIKAAKMVLELSDQTSRTLREATKTILAAKILDRERIDQILAVALKEGDLEWLSSVEHLQALSFYEKDLIFFIEARLNEIKNESPDLFVEMTSLMHNREEMDMILNKVQSGKELTDEHMIGVFQAVYVAFDHMNEELAMLKSAIYDEPAARSQKNWQKIEKMQEYEDRMRDRQLERSN